MGIKTPRTVAIVLLHNVPTNRAELKHQMNFDDKWIDKNSITSFKFLGAATYADLQVILGFLGGAIRIQRLSESTPVHELNTYLKDTKK